MLNQIDLSRADLNLLVLFETVIEERHVGRAAERLSLSPSAVSHGLGRLRALLGDPLFLRTPRGVAPTARAEELAPAIFEALARIRGILASTEPFDPARSRRRFVIGAPDAIAAVFLPRLLARLAETAPGVAIGIRQLLPRPGKVTDDLVWGDALAALDARAIDLAVLPQDRFPARFARRPAYEEIFVVAARKGHPFLAAPTLDSYCAAEHLVVSDSGDAHAWVDALLAEQGLSRRVALSVPNFFFALLALADSDLIAALPARFLAAHAARFGVEAVAPPIPLGRFDCSIVAPEPALRDAGVAWLVGMIEASVGGAEPSDAARGPA